MTLRSFRFDRFSLDAEDRTLSDGDGPVELSSRYFDALVLLVSEQGRLVGKDRFMDEVWRGVPVTDEALTQCIRTLRRQLGDDAARPRFIETVPKHGYRFIAPVETGGTERSRRAPRKAWHDLLVLGLGGTLGGGLAGILGGLFYGFAAADADGAAAISVLLVLFLVTTAIALIGAAGVAFGIAAATVSRTRATALAVAGGAAGGLVVGAIVKLIGLDALMILFGHSPGNVTGAGEGLVIGGATGAAAWLGAGSLRRSALAGGLSGAAAGVLLAAAGGHMMGGSLAELAQHFPGSRLRLDWISATFGENGFGEVTRAVTAAAEGALFASCVAGSIAIAGKRLQRRH